jgi:flagellar basal-body rod modification protein FlgD
MTAPVSSSGVNVTTPPASSSSTGVPDFTSNFNTFLTMLTTQLQHQDPLSPLDTSQFTQQLVAFSQVEQQINTNTNLQQLLQLQTTNEAVSAAPLVGVNIQYNSPTSPLEGGNAGWSYSLPSDSASTNLLVEDASGNVVFSAAGMTTAGKHDFVWNGKTSAGLQMPDGGQYTLKVEAADANKNTVTATVSAYGTVDGVNITNTGTGSSTAGTNSQANLDVGGMAVPLSELMSINPTINPNK